MTSASDNKGLDKAVRRAANIIERAEGLIIAAGAGMGVDSGLPDFRSPGGFWRAYPALGKREMSFREIANGQTFYAHPALAWGFYGHRLRLYRQVEPHEGFRILLDWARAKRCGGFVITTNVDGQFQKARFDSRRLWEIHGSIHHLQCIGDCCGEIWSSGSFEPTVDEESCLLANELPRCKYCGAIARPNVLMFDDWQWAERRSNTQQEAFFQWLHVTKRFVIVECGAGSELRTLRALGERLACAENAQLIRINTQDAEGDLPGVSLGTGALDAIQRIHAELKTGQRRS